MADEMLRIAGRDSEGTAKAIKTDGQGNVGVTLTDSYIISKEIENKVYSGITSGWMTLELGSCDWFMFIVNNTEGYENGKLEIRYIDLQPVGSFSFYKHIHTKTFIRLSTKIQYRVTSPLSGTYGIKVVAGLGMPPADRYTGERQQLFFKQQFIDVPSNGIAAIAPAVLEVKNYGFIFTNVRASTNHDFNIEHRFQNYDGDTIHFSEDNYHLAKYGNSGFKEVVGRYYQPLIRNKGEVTQTYVVESWGVL